MKVTAFMVEERIHISFHSRLPRLARLSGQLKVSLLCLCTLACSASITSACHYSWSIISVWCLVCWSFRAPGYFCRVQYQILSDRRPFCHFGKRLGVLSRGWAHGCQTSQLVPQTSRITLRILRTVLLLCFWAVRCNLSTVFGLMVM